MVFESLVVDLVNRFLGDFIENLDKSQLSIGIWGGDIVLNNLFIKENVFNELDLPVKVIYGNLGQLKLKIPWKNLYTEPTIAILDGLYVIAVPTSSVAYNDEKEKKALWETKQKELAKIEAAKKREAEKDIVKDAKQDSFAEKLVTNVIKNLEVKITNIHVRYEDNYTNPQKPFSIGVTLKELSCQTTDEHWSVRIIKEATNNIFKLLKLDSLSFYWNLSPTLYMKQEKDRTAIQAVLKTNIVDSAKKSDYLYNMIVYRVDELESSDLGARTDHDFVFLQQLFGNVLEVEVKREDLVVEPLTSNAKLKLNTKPEVDGFILPKVLLDIVFEEIIVALGKSQYQLLMEFLESFERMQLSSKFRKYHPADLPKHGNSQRWWEFAYKCILEETVKRRRRMWSWEHIKKHRVLCRHYREIYKTKLLNSKPSSDLLVDIERCEKELDVLNITIMRQQAEAEAKKEGAKKQGSSGGWFGGWFGGGKKQAPTAEEKSVGDKVQEIMTAEEKQKLYEAIGYQENVDTEFPKEYVANKLSLKLESLRVKLLDADAKCHEVLHLQLKDVRADIEQRPAAEAIKVNANMKSLSMTGQSIEDAKSGPAMVSSDNAGSLIDVLFETNPMDGGCDTRVNLNTRPLKITYDAKTVISLATFFKPPESIYIVQLQAAAMAKLEKVKQQTATGLQFALEQHKFTEITVNVQPTYVIVPQTGFFTPNCRMLVLDLGHLSISTDKPKDLHEGGKGEPMSSRMSMDDIKKNAYDRFKFQIQSFQLLYVSPGEDWIEARKNGSTPMHILRPMGVNIDLFRCILVDAQLPKMRVIGELPIININMSDERLLDILSLVHSIPLPESSSPDSFVDDEVDAALRAVDLRNMPIREETTDLATALQASSLQKSSDLAKSKESDTFVNAKEMELKFEVKEICLSISKRKNNQDIPTLKLVLESIGVDLQVRSFDTNVTAFLGGLYLQHTQFKASDEMLAWYANSRALVNGPLINLVNTPSVDDQKFRLLTVNVLMAHKKHPEFSTTYNNTLQTITINFSTLELVLHQEAILNVIEFAQSVQTAMEAQPAAEKNIQIVRQLSKSSLASVSAAVKKIETRKARKKAGVEIIDIAILANLENLFIAVCNEQRILTDVKIIGLESRVTLQKSMTCVDASLKDITVFDRQPQPTYPKILSFEGGQVFQIGIIVYNFATQGQGYSNPQAVDTSVILNTGCMKIVVLNKFIQDLLNFLDQFQVAKDKITEASQAVADRAASAAQDLSQKAMRISLNIDLDAPVIIVPQNSTSNNCIVIDLGKLKVNNGFQILSKKDSHGLPAILDNMLVELNQLKVFRALVMETEVKAECLMLEPVSMQLNILRNLSAAWYHGHPDVEITGKLHKFSILMSQGDFTTVMSVLNENLQEGNTKDQLTASGKYVETAAEDPKPAPTTKDATSDKNAVAKLEPQESSLLAEVYSSLKARFSIENIKLELFTGSSELVSGADNSRDVNKSFAKIQLITLDLLAEIKSDKSIRADISLNAFQLIDSRPSQQAGITEMVTQSVTSLTKAVTPNMIALCFVQDAKSNIDVDLKVNSLYVVLCVDFLMRLSDFFLKGITPPATSVTQKTTAEKPSAKKQVAAASEAELKVQFSLNQPEIVLVEDALKPDSNALFLEMQVDFLLRQTPTLQSMKGGIKGLSVVSCSYAREKRDSTKAQILHPLDIQLQSSAPYSKNHHMAISMSDVNLTVSSSSIRILTATLASLSVPIEESESNELLQIPKELWAVKKLEDCNYWFLTTEESNIRSDAGEETGAAILDKELRELQSLEVDRGEQLILNEGRITITLLGGTGKRLVPFILTELVLRNADIRNWSTKLHVACEMTLQSAYYNEKVAAWEPLIEPVESDNRHRPWELLIEVHQNDLLSPNEDETDGSSALPPPLRSINIVSNDVMQLTVTKSALDVFKNLGQSFNDAYHLVTSPVASEEVVAPYVVRNESGMFVTVSFGDCFQTGGGSNTKKSEAGLDLGQSISLYSKTSNSNSALKSIMSFDSIYGKVLDDQVKKLTVKFEDLGETRELKLMRAEKRAFNFNQRAEAGEVWQLVSQIDSSYGSKTVILRSVVQISSKLPLAVEMYYKLSDDAMGRCGVVHPDESFCLPCDAVYAAPFEIFLKPSDGSYSESSRGFKWRDCDASSDLQLIECKGSKDSPTIYITAKVDIETVFFESTNERTVKLYTITLQPAMAFKNLLPMPVICKSEGAEDSVRVEPGEKVQLMGVNPGVTSLVLTFSYQNHDWTGSRVLDVKPELLSVWTFESLDNGQRLNLDLGLHCETSNGYQNLSLYCPYWMVNLTERDLSYKASDDYIVEHKANFKEAVFFLFKKSTQGARKSKMKDKNHSRDHDGASMNSGMRSHSNMSVVTMSSSTNSLDNRKSAHKNKSRINKNVKVALKLGESDWSDKFSLDTAGSVGIVQCKSKGQNVPVGVKITLSSTGLTKIITFTPFFMVINQAAFTIMFKEHTPGSEWIEIEPDACIPFWPLQTGSTKQLVACIKGTAVETLPFGITESHTTLLKLFHDYGGINVECQALEAAITVTFQQYYPGFASALLVNHTINISVEYHQQEMSDSKLTLGAKQAVLYTWQDPARKRELVWSCGEKKATITDELIKDGIGDVFIDNDTKMYWISFLDGMQRVILFTEDIALAAMAQEAGELEQTDNEINLSLQGFGISLVNNMIGKEIAYMAITSSGVIWEEQKKKRFKALKGKTSVALEESYQNFLSEVATNRSASGIKTVEGKEVNFGIDAMMMNKKKIRRSFEYGIWMRLSMSQHAIGLHLKVHRFQLDNQLSGAVFQTVLAPIPPPKSVAAESVPKPLTELSVMMRTSSHSNVKQFKYCKLLVQEMAIKVDQGFIEALVGLFVSSNEDETQQLVEFRQDCQLVSSSLLTDATMTSASGVKNFYDMLHFSPLKIHLSFSMYGGSDSEGKAKPELHFNVLGLFLQSVGVVLTDIQDVVFKLGYFERKYAFYNQTQLTGEITRHYSQQAIKQMYVLVLGLDVLGNPFGVIRGLAEGIEDLFYEPYQGAIQGPEEFAEGLANGVKSLLGHAVGGAAGAVSRITGALGKGIATLTMDEDYQKKRREALNRQPADFKEGLARGGKGLVMGVFDGVTGIVTKPMEGARQEGFGGFFKGIGRGLVGVVTRPASGVVDFASSSFEGIRRVAEQSDEVHRLRPTRLIPTDGLVRPYVYHDAEGNQILQDTEKGKYITDLYLGHLICSADGRSVLLVTDKNVIFASKGDLFGHWDCQWGYSWDLLSQAPSLSPTGIQILLKEKQKKFFGSSSIGKLVTVLDKDKKYAEFLVGKMKTAMNAAASAAIPK